MAFTSTVFLTFYAVVLALYWSLRDRRFQNVLLLVGSYVFYGFVHPWFCVLIASSTLVDYLCGRAMGRFPGAKRYWLIVSLTFNLGLLGVFKYYDFFAQSFANAASTLGWELQHFELLLVLPVGISFYTFQTLSYTIDVYRGQLKPRRNLLDFAVFVSFFPQLVAGPIERAARFLPQLENARRWSTAALFPAIELIVGGFLKKLVVADNVSRYVDEIFELQSPSLALLAVGALGFAVQIYADFSAYTDIARGISKLLGFDLVQNFRSPYLAVSPSDFWRRWHISFSSWIRDYLYIPLGGSRVKSPLGFFAVLIASLGLSGLWHGAAWNFVLWGLYHACLVFLYHRMGFGGRWTPPNGALRAAAVACMFGWTLGGWLLFRTGDLSWLAAALQRFRIGLSGDLGAAAAYTLGLMLLYASPMFVQGVIERLPSAASSTGAAFFRGAFLAAALIAIALFAGDGSNDFIYFRF
ncbi:MAG: D-alanyl-lipoteichoic acid acyltransferase DltB (MBOAT superfamily) [Planctomycetota bacterium]|jgi:D-alanyl-lipoteichoic acid acyltransferase DltB (MBOAT superfamily)